MSTLNDAKMPSLKDKLEEKVILENKLVEVDDAIDKITGEKKVKISKKKVFKRK